MQGFNCLGATLCRTDPLTDDIPPLPGFSTAVLVQAVHLLEYMHRYEGSSAEGGGDCSCDTRLLHPAAV